MTGDYDIYDLPKRVQNAEERLKDAQEGGEVTDTDADAIRDYVRQRRVNEDLSGHTVEGMYGKLRVAATESDIPLMDVSDKDDVTSVLAAVKFRRGEGNPLSEKSMSSYKSYLRKFFDYYNRDFVEEISVSRSNSADRNIDPKNMLTTDDLKEMRKAAANPRDTALMAMLMDTGARISMLATLRIKDLDLDSEPPVYTPNQNASSLKAAPHHAYPLIDSVADLRTYLNLHHPRSDEPEAPLFHKMPGYYRPEDGDDGAMAHDTIRQNLKRTANRASIDKPVNAHNWRHSAVTRMLREGYSSKEIQHRAGWKDPSMLERYEHVEADEMNTQIGVSAGIVDEDEGESRKRARCGTCREVLDPSAEYCPKCGVPVTPEARRRREGAENLRSEIAQTALSETELAADEREGLRAMLDAVDDPQAFAKQVEGLAPDE
ncbi:hypothetical protein DMJ13_03610 [halophilic archaeon]|nr:hypothetical protein DMJ13_03610 [halophilic archaeon]